MTTKAKKQRPPKPRPVQHAAPRTARSRRAWLPLLALGAVLVVASVLALTILGGSRKDAARASAGLPNTPDYHSLLVDPSNAQKLVLGTHSGLYLSADGGKHWRAGGLSGDDAMNLARPGGATIWLAGHNVLERSRDNGNTWTDIRPTGLPSLDIHGFAVDPRNGRTLYAAVAGEGLYRSSDGGVSFRLRNQRVGGAVMALAVLPSGRILAGDMQQGLLHSRDGGATWQQTLAAQVMGLAVNPGDPRRLLATGSGIALSTDSGATWTSVLDLPEGAGPVAWAKSDPKLAYVVGLDRTLYRSTDGGESWQPVAAGS